MLPSARSQKRLRPKLGSGLTTGVEPLDTEKTLQNGPHECGTTNPMAYNPCMEGTAGSVRHGNPPALPAPGRRCELRPAIPRGLTGLGHRPGQQGTSVRPLELAARTSRNPRLMLRSPGCQLLRYAQRQLRALLAQEPPRFTRFLLLGDAQDHRPSSADVFSHRSPSPCAPAGYARWRRRGPHL